MAPMSSMNVVTDARKPEGITKEVYHEELCGPMHG